ncbi:RICIN domain-containing protein [Eubacterium aggregans]|uniref:RICIN domain-containing protein n=1 Tax=Eubacterium aggregans TaxID=81409 RepID=UPI003F67B335
MSATEEASQDGQSFIIPSKLLLDDGSEYDITTVCESAFTQILGLRKVVVPDSVVMFEKDCFLLESEKGRTGEQALEVNQVVVYANAGSSAETFTKENGIALITDGVKFDSPEDVLLNIGEKKSITVTCPEIFDKDTAIKWSVENEKIVSIDTNSVISALSPGKTTIWAECEGLKNSLDVEVKELPDSGAETSTMSLESSAFTGIRDGGIYNIVSSLNTNMVLDVNSASKNDGANIQLWSYNGTDAQLFKAQKNSDGTWTFININSNKAIDLAVNENRNGANIQQYTSNGTYAQKWQLMGNDDGTVTFLNSNGKVIDIYGAQTYIGTNVQLYQSNGTKAQRFVLKSNNSYSGIYTFKSSLNQGKVVDISGGAITNGANVQLYDSNNTNAQKFNVEALENGYYKITNMKSEKVLDVSNAGKANGTNIQQFEWNDTSVQHQRRSGKFKITEMVVLR